MRRRYTNAGPLLKAHARGHVIDELDRLIAKYERNIQTHTFERR